MTTVTVDGAGAELARLSASFHALTESPQLVFQMLDMFPIPVQVLGPDGVMVFANRAILELNNVPDASIVVGNYNMRTDPVLNDAMGLRAVVERAFGGETVVVPDFRPPVRDLVDRGVVAEQPFDSASMDAFLYPVWDGDRLAYVVNVLLVKQLYQGHPDVALAKRFIEAHWREEFDPAAVARSASISVRQLYALFQEHGDVTPKAYYRRIKVDRLKEKLAETHLSVAEAFAACGLDSRGAYARHFKQETGLSPLRYRASLTR